MAKAISKCSISNSAKKKKKSSISRSLSESVALVDGIKVTGACSSGTTLPKIKCRKKMVTEVGRKMIFSYPREFETPN